jgi:hypothetical protein
MAPRSALVLGVVVVAVAFGAWRALFPAADETSRDVTEGVSVLLQTTSTAAFVGAQASIAAQYSATGTYAGARVPPPARLVRADATSYCVEVTQGTTVAHANGPGGAPQPGPC